MERSDVLAGCGWRFYYDDAVPPGTDTFLLSGFPRLRPHMQVCDLGAGSGLLGLLLLRREPTLRVTAVELLSQAVRLGEKTAAENGLGDRLTFCRADLRRPEQLPPPGSQALVVCNPPYFPVGSGFAAQGAARRGARCEESCTLEDMCAAAARLLRWGGSFCLVHRPERLVDVLAALRGHGMEPKRLRPVCKEPGSAPTLFLVEGRRGGRPGLETPPPLALQTPAGRPTAEVDAIYMRQGEETP